MKLKDFMDVAIYDNYLVNVHSGSIELVKEFKSTDKLRLKPYENYIVTGIWVLDKDTMCVSVLKGDD